MAIEMISVIENLGFPIIIFAITTAIIMYIIKKEEKGQMLNNKRYNELTNKFIDTIQKISDENNKMLKELSDGIHNAMDKFDEQQKR